ncbi:winged helix-turn-helix transcriptional regulator [Chitinophaga solisilvae]|uniref:winged helix-turn-helix transcriptional regulator n=1 Tax=Chitinophaga solisilvae TaxID=1233460 RepID=UPI001371D010|nr:helix-turn-helix domain-containing protein [Chitinophaga solisilvae]
MASLLKENSTNAENFRKLAICCDVNVVLNSIGLRWKMQILYCIADGVDQFGKISRYFPTLSDQVLSRRIAELSREDLIVKTTLPDSGRLQIQYSITEKGRELLELILRLQDWGKKWQVVPALP